MIREGRANEIHRSYETYGSNAKAKGEFPQNMYIVVAEPYEKPAVYLGEFREAEEDEMVFETVGV